MLFPALTQTGGLVLKKKTSLTKAKKSHRIWYPTYNDQGELQKKLMGYITASTSKQALFMFKSGWGRHLVPGAIQVASIRDRLQAEAIE